MVSVLIVDNHPATRYGLKQILKEEFRAITFGEASTGEEALFEAVRRPWTLIVIDVAVPGRTGFLDLDRIRIKRPTSKLLVLSASTAAQSAERALRMGAAGYVTKEASRAEIIVAVKSVLAGRKYVSSALTNKQHPRLAAGDDIGPKVLSSRERTVLLALAAGKRVTEIALELNLNSKTVSTYRRRILDKLHLNSGADLVRYAMNQQLC